MSGLILCFCLHGFHLFLLVNNNFILRNIFFAHNFASIVQLISMILVKSECSTTSLGIYHYYCMCLRGGGTGCAGCIFAHPISNLLPIPISFQQKKVFKIRQDLAQLATLFGFSKKVWISAPIIREIPQPLYLITRHHMTETPYISIESLS